MSTNRRDFIERTAGAALLGAIPFSLTPTAAALAAPTPTSEEWDVTWANRLTGKHKAVFDVPEVESGYGVWRASVWARQYVEVLGAKPNELSTVLILRHNGIVLAMQQSFWDKYKIGETKKVTHPITLQPTDRNPALLSSARGEVPDQFDAAALDKFLARGNIALACNLALADCVELIKTKDGVAEEEARKRAIAYLVPGVILQPSGVFAAVKAQQAGCHYVRAS